MDAGLAQLGSARVAVEGVGLRSVLPPLPDRHQGASEGERRDSNPLPSGSQPGASTTSASFTMMSPPGLEPGSQPSQDCVLSSWTTRTWGRARRPTFDHPSSCCQRSLDPSVRSEDGGIRTHNLRVRSAALIHLSLVPRTTKPRLPFGSRGFVRRFRCCAYMKPLAPASPCCSVRSTHIAASVPGTGLMMALVATVNIEGELQRGAS